ncbi:hypothetical protein [Leptospira kanakyensis]|uniref:Uncharacterized protein n=2 Tax=Leptospira kanakyensis TaxID=2484968 RepID=A0A6N4QBA7_9LEPT|nr:hypothetical protein [Leptospira kanakyensis]TGK53857.1 hypothetical protein EHQ11_05890 [Leptospira kanakyensis]TGK73362.1 hypothetical protein EHQ18_05965 [Leptospira kanakyensis]
MIKTKSYIFLTIVMFLILFTQVNCHTEYKNAPEVCLAIQAQSQINTNKDLQDLNTGLITEARFTERLRLREEGALVICMVSLIKTKENSNF